MSDSDESMLYVCCSDEDDCDDECLLRCGQVSVGAAEKRLGGGMTGFGTSCVVQIGLL